MEKYCYCEGCRFNDSHTTAYHKCGKCGIFGHGRLECPINYNGCDKLKNLLYEKYINKGDPLILPKEKWCQVKDCKIRQTHNSNSHHLLFSKDEYANYEGPDQYNVRKILSNNKQKGHLLVKNHNNSFVKLWWGMGLYNFTRNKNGKIETKNIDSTNYEEINKFTFGLTEIKNKNYEILNN